jgi:L-fuconolactonase
MTIIDTQLHEPTVSMTWASVDTQTRHRVMTELQLGFMRAVGVDQAVLFPIDLEWGLNAAKLLPDIFRVVPMISPQGVLGGIDAGRDDIEHVIATYAADDSVVGMRILRLLPPFDVRPVPLEVLDRAVAACDLAGLPLFVPAAGDPDVAGEIAARHRDLTVVVDHLGMPQPPSHGRDVPPFKGLASLLRLSALPNIVIKLSGAPTLSTQAYPFADLWTNLLAIVEAFGADRLMWGSDISRVHGRIGFDMRIADGEMPYEGKHNYAEALMFLSESDHLSKLQKDLILGGTAQKVLDWPDHPVEGG